MRDECRATAPRFRSPAKLGVILPPSSFILGGHRASVTIRAKGARHEPRHSGIRSEIPRAARRMRHAYAYLRAGLRAAGGRAAFGAAGHAQALSGDQEKTRPDPHRHRPAFGVRYG